MKTWTSFASAVFLLISVTCSWCAESVQAPAKSLEPVALAYRFDQREVVRYMVTQRITGSQTMPGQPTRNIDAELSAVIRLERTHIYDDGTLDLTVSMESAAMKSDGKPVDGYAPSRDIFVMPFARQGPMNPKNLDFGSVESMPFMLFLANKPVAIGATWAQDIPLRNNWPSKVHLGFTLTGLKDGNAAIKQQMNTTTGMKSPRDSTPAGNLQEGLADIVFDTVSGKLISSRGVVRSSLSTIVGGNTRYDKFSIKDRISTTKVDCVFTVDILKEPTQPAK